MKTYDVILPPDREKDPGTLLPKKETPQPTEKRGPLHD